MRHLTELEVRTIKSSQLPVSKLARTFGVSKRRIYQIRPAGQCQNRMNGYGGGRAPYCVTCGSSVYFSTNGTGNVVEICEKGHRTTMLRLEGETGIPVM
jgi:hypothetical protein